MIRRSFAPEFASVRLVRAWFRIKAKAAGAVDPGELSRRLMLVFAGAQAQALIEQSGRPARDARRLAVELVEAAAGTHRS